jgi:hypothetical protein
MIAVLKYQNTFGKDIIGMYEVIDLVEEYVVKFILHKSYMVTRITH